MDNRPVAGSHPRMRPRSPALLAALLLAACAASPRPAPTADEAAIRAIVDEVYAIVSGDKAQPRDWDRLRQLFVEGGAMHVSMRRGEGAAAASFDLEQFIAMATRNSQQAAFFEEPLVTRVEAFAGVGYAWSSYTEKKARDAEPFGRGVNCFSFVKGKDGWRIVAIAWSEENDRDKLPASMLPQLR